MSVRRPGFQHASFHPGENKGDELLDLEQRKALLASKPSFLPLGQSIDVSSVTGSVFLYFHVHSSNIFNTKCFQTIRYFSKETMPIDL